MPGAPKGESVHINRRKINIQFILHWNQHCRHLERHILSGRALPVVDDAELLVSRDKRRAIDLTAEGPHVTVFSSIDHEDEGLIINKNTHSIMKDLKPCEVVRVTIYDKNNIVI